MHSYTALELKLNFNKKTTMKKTIYTALLVATSLFSCSDFLDRDPYYVVTNENAINSFDKAEAAVGGAYATLTGDSWAGGLYAAQASKAGFIDWKIIDYTFDYTETENAPGVNTIWKDFYTTINRANFAIEGIPRLDASLVPSEEAREALIAEARCIRAWAHINLLWNFGHWWANDNDEYGILYRDELADLSNITKARISVGESYEKIYADLDYAIEHLSTYTTPRYMSAEFAKALKAKILLYRGAYNNNNDTPALNEALLLINDVLASSSNLSMESDLETFYEQAWDSNENLFANYLENDGKRTQKAGTYYNLSVIENGDPRPYDPNTLTAGLIYGADWFRQDPRWDIVTGDIRSGVRFSSNRFWSWKKVARYGANDGIRFGDEKYASYFLRYPELYIMKAELLARTGASISEAIAPINTMRSMRTNPVLSALNPSNQEELMDMIFQEYFLELFLENGSEFFASLRFFKNGNPWINTIKPGVSIIENKLCWPIPEEEMTNNKLMKQNPDLD